MVDVSDLDAKALEVLEAVYESGGEANTSEIKEYTGIQKNGIVHYRYEKLEEAGLIERKSGEAEGTKFATTVVSLTEEGEQEIRGYRSAESAPERAGGRAPDPDKVHAQLNNPQE